MVSPGDWKDGCYVTGKEGEGKKQQAERDTGEEVDIICTVYCSTVLHRVFELSSACMFSARALSCL